MHLNNIWHIDDDEDDQEFFQIALQQVAPTIQYSGFTYAEKALKQLHLAESLPQIIFLDLNMPGMNGEQFLINIRKEMKFSAIPIYVFTTSAQQSAMDRMKTLGASRFITKPNNYLHLVDLLKNILL